MTTGLLSIRVFLCSAATYLVLAGQAGWTEMVAGVPATAAAAAIAAAQHVG